MYVYIEVKKGLRQSVLLRVQKITRSNTKNEHVSVKNDAA